MKTISENNGSCNHNLGPNRTRRTGIKIDFTLIILKSNARGMQYGMGSYLRELTCSLHQYRNVRIILVHYNNKEAREFSVMKKSVFQIEVIIPATINSHLNWLEYDMKYSSAVLNLLDSIIPTDSKVVFLVNYISEYYLVKRIKERYTHPIVSVAHSAQWQLFFNVNRKKFEAIGTEALVKKPEINILQEKRNLPNFRYDYFSNKLLRRVCRV